MLIVNWVIQWYVEVDKKKAKHYYEQAAMIGSVTARYNLGRSEGKAGNHRLRKGLQKGSL